MRATATLELGPVPAGPGQSPAAMAGRVSCSQRLPGGERVHQHAVADLGRHRASRWSHAAQLNGRAGRTRPGPGSKAGGISVCV